MRLAFRTGRPPHPVTGCERYRVLIIDDLVPDPLFGAGYPRAFAITRALLDAGHLVDYYPMQASRADLSRMRRSLEGAIFHPGEGARGLRRLLWRKGSSFDALFVSRPAPMQSLIDAHWEPASGTAPAVIYDAEAVISPRELRRRSLFGPSWSPEDYEIALAAELELARSAQAITAVGEGDARIIRSVLDVPVFVLPHPVTIRSGLPSFAERRDILFVGRLTGPASNSPNVDSVLWFLDEIMPLLDRMIGTDYRVHIAGRLDASPIAAKASSRIVLHGVVEDLQTLYDESRLFVAPTRYAAGIPLKVVEAMGEGIPCVATPLLAEQLGTNGMALATGATPADFARECARLYTDAQAWQNAQAGGHAYVERSCSPCAFRQVLADVLKRAVSAREDGLS